MSKLKVDEIRSADRSVSSTANITLTDAGKVGIGVSSPDSLFEVAGTLGIKTAQPSLYFDRSGAYAWSIRNGDGSGNFPLSTLNVVNNGGTPTMTFKDDGNVGIGVTSPAVRLTSLAPGEGNPATSGTTQTNASARFYYGGGGLDIGNFSSGSVWMQGCNPTDLSVNRDIVLQTNGGKVGIGSSDSSVLGILDVRGPAGGSSVNNIHLTYTPTGADTDSWYFSTGGNARLNITNRGTGNGAYLKYDQQGWTNLSDRRWKTDWTPITGSLEKLLNIEVAKYHLLVGDDPSSLEKAELKEGLNERWNVGVSAQDCLEAGLEDVVDCPVLEGSGDENSQKGINYNQLTAICVQAIQELSAKVTALENK